MIQSNFGFAAMGKVRSLAGVLFCAFVCWNGSLPSAHGLTITQRYDFEQITGSNTEPGWTHMATNIAGSPTTAGFLPATEGGLNGINRIPSIQAPFLVIEDEIYAASGPTVGGSDMVFRDIIPAWAESVQLTIHRNDTADSFIANFITQVSINGGPLTTIDTGIPGNGFYHAPIIATINLPLTGSIQTLDFHFFDQAINSSQVRINGIEAIYSIPPAPEPSSLVLWGLMSVCIARLRRSRQQVS